MQCSRVRNLFFRSVVSAPVTTARFLITRQASTKLFIGAFASGLLRRVLLSGGSSSTTACLVEKGLFIPIRHNSTTATLLTIPKLFVSGLSRLTTDEKLKEVFSPFGQLLEARVITDRVSGRSKGFAFVRYATIEEAEKAREEMNAKFLDGWVIFIDPAKPREPRPPPQAEPEPSETGFRTNKTIGWCG